MQRRAAAIYAAVFVLVAAGAYATIAVAQEPTISVSNPAFELSENGGVTIGDRDYTLGEVTDATNEGTDRRSSQLVWVDESARATESWATGESVTIGDTDFDVATDPDATPPSVTLTEVQTLGENVATADVNGTTYVVVEEDGRRTLVPREEYLRETQGPPETRTLARGDTLQYQNRTTRIDEVANDSATVSWTAPAENPISIREGSTVELGGTTYAAHFPDNRTLQLMTDVEGYERQAAAIETYGERINGLWGVSLLSGISAVLLIGFAYLPSRY